MYQSGSLQYRQLGTSQLKKQGARLHPSGTHTPQRTVGRTDENGSVWQGTYKFNKNGTYTRTNIEIDKQGNKKEANIYGQWSFGDPSFSTIYFGGEHYWDIDELTKNKFSFYDRSGKFGDPFMNREYIELTPYQENNTTN